MSTLPLLHQAQMAAVVLRRKGFRGPRIDHAVVLLATGRLA